MYRSYGVLRYAKILSTADALMQYAQLKLGHDHGMVTLSQEPDLYAPSNHFLLFNPDIFPSIPHPG